MPRGYWRAVFAIVGWLILSAAYQPSQTPKGGKGAEQAAPTAQPVTPPVPAPTASPSPKFKAYRGYNPDPCYHAEDHDAADLCAQWRAALAAEKAAHEAKRATAWAIVATVLSALGVMGLILTIWQTHGALSEARRGNILSMRENARGTRRALATAQETSAALDYSRQAADAAADQVVVVQDTAKRQLRAYISIEPGGINEAIDGKHRVPLNIINTGQTPARDIELFGDFLVVTGSPLEFNPETHGRFGGVLASTDHSLGGQTNRWTFAYLDSEMVKPFWDRIAEKESAVIHYGFVQYKDVFGETWKTGFAFYHWGEEWSDLESKRCRLGNYAT